MNLIKEETGELCTCGKKEGKERKGSGGRRREVRIREIKGEVRVKRRTRKALFVCLFVCRLF